MGYFISNFGGSEIHWKIKNGTVNVSVILLSMVLVAGIDILEQAIQIFSRLKVEHQFFLEKDEKIER